MTERTSSEALADYKKVMGDELGVIFHHLLQETWHLSSVWDQYETLYGNKERISLLNESGGYFFRNVQDIFFNHVLLGICRLTDPPQSGKKENLTVQRLPFLVRSSCKEAVVEAVSDAISASQFSRDWRNRFIAHNDLGRYTEISPPLEPATRLGVTAAIVAIHEVLRPICMDYREGDLALLEIGNDAAFNLLHQLRRGRDAKDEQRKRLSAGDFRESDYVFPEWLKPQGSNLRYQRKRK
ncbi:AbiU2 domain-containing protein [Oryzicola mucosus]|uniref:HEPN AbiU2-like domain-containing protein n=1 Tax=Oryzicola mucosus TaxID=2767425 RepID=A0A8J6PXS4_9HYPH|nr:hypothetical protein [Oryzicola mucosus]MBD0416192.1 hypothetical protein [Oryzicola mucosus]